MAAAPLRLHFENAVGRVSEQAVGSHGGGYIEVEYFAAPRRRFGDLQTLLGHAKQLLALRGWNKVLGDQRHMEPFSEQEEHWVTAHWLRVPRPQSNPLYGAVVLPAEVFAKLSAEVATAPGQASAMTYRLFDELAPAREWLSQLQ